MSGFLQVGGRDSRGSVERQRERKATEQRAVDVQRLQGSEFVE